MDYLPADNRYSSMRYNRVGASGVRLPAISLGLWHNFGDVDVFQNGRTIARRAFDLGITHFDLANNYGPSPGSAEENFGALIAKDFRPYRDELIISSKAGYLMWPGPYGEWGSRKYLVASCDQSLKRMGLQYVDIFYSHRFDPGTPLEETMGALDFIVRSGRALYAGISSYDAEQTTRAAKHTSLDPDSITHDKVEKVRKLNEIAKARRQSLAQMAVAWTLRDPVVTSSLIGASKVAHVEEAVAALNNLTFSAAEIQAIEAALK